MAPGFNPADEEQGSSRQRRLDPVQPDPLHQDVGRGQGGGHDWPDGQRWALSQNSCSQIKFLDNLQDLITPRECQARNSYKKLYAHTTFNYM